MANMNFKANILPATSQGYNLGSSTQQWVIHGPIYTNGIFGTPDVDYGATLPSTATEGQIFFQTSSTVVYSVPAGGTAGYALVKDSNADGDFSWQEVALEIPPVPVEVFHGNITTAAGTAAKVLSCSDFTSSNLQVGAIVYGTVTNTNSAAVADLTLNVNSTGAKPLRYMRNKTISNLPGVDYLIANQTYQFHYDGTYWIVDNIAYDANTTYSAMSANEIKGGTATTQRTMRADYIKSALADLGGSGLTLSHNITEGIVLNHSNVVTAKSSYVATTTTANSAGGSIQVTDVKYDTEGHITGSQDRTITLGLVAGYGDTTNPYATKTANYVLAAPAAGNGAPTFRKLTLTDLPELNIVTATTGVLPISRGGTGATTAEDAWTNLGGGSVGKLNLGTCATYYLANNGTWTTPPGTYVLPEATTAVLGGVTIDPDGGIAVDQGAISVDWSDAPVKSVNNMTGNVVLNPLIVGTAHYNGATTAIISASDLGLASPMTFVGVTDSIIQDGIDTTPINIISGGTTIGSHTPSNGDVILQKTEQMEFIYSENAWHQLGVASSYSLAEHTHGFILNDGVLMQTVTATTNDRLLIADASDSYRVVGSNLTLDASASASALSRSGQWVDYLQLSGGTMTGAVKTKGLVGTLNVDYGDILPTTATEGQVFFQVSYGDGDFSLPAGGTAGYALVKNSSADGDVKWGLITANDRVLKAGDTITGQIKKAGLSCSYWNGRDNAMIRTNTYVGYAPIVSMKSPAGSWEIGPYTNDQLDFVYISDTVYSSGSNTGMYGTVKIMPNGGIYGAVWNDYAEFRQADTLEPGRVIKENGDDTLSLSTKRLERGCEIISDTFGLAIGETDKAKTPTAATGRVLAYPYESREVFKEHIGWPVCSGPNGTVSLMSEEEEEKYPSRIIGTVSAVPDYKIWFGGMCANHAIEVNGRVWIRIR